MLGETLEAAKSMQILPSSRLAPALVLDPIPAHHAMQVFASNDSAFCKTSRRKPADCDNVRGSPRYLSVDFSPICLAARSVPTGRSGKSSLLYNHAIIMRLIESTALPVASDDVRARAGRADDAAGHQGLWFSVCGHSTEMESDCLHCA